MATKTIMTMTCVLALFVLAGCGSDSTTTAPTAIDTQPPAVPSQLAGDSWNSQITIYWAPNTTDTDWAGYNVYRSIGERTVCLTETPLVQNMYVDSMPRNEVNTYLVTSVDASGNESAQASIDVQVEDPGYPYHPAKQ